jgi:hypothetical protein
MMKETMHEIFGEIIHSYTRAEAIEDGSLVDVSEIAKEAGFKFPVAMTRTVWGRYVEVPQGVSCQDEQGRLWDILFMLRDMIRRNRVPSDTMKFSLLVRNDNRRPKLVTLKSVCGPGDNGEPVITIMMTDED